MRFPVIPGLLAAALSLAPVDATAQLQTNQLRVVDGIVAVVDEDVILQSELDIAVNNIRSQYRGRETQLPPDNVLQRQVLERLILLRLQVARAEATGIRIGDTELTQTMQAMAAEAGLTLDQFRQRLTSEGLGFEDYRRGLREEMQARRLQQRVVQSRVVVSEGEINQALSENMVGAAEYRLANLLVALPDAPTPEQLETAQRKIEGIKGLIDRGEMDFRAAAIRYSDDRNALDGGDLGWREANAIPPRFAELIRTLQPGQVTDPIRGPSGFQLIQLVETREGGGPATATQFQADHLLVAVTDVVGEEQARQKLDGLRAEIEAGGDFAKIAREHSDDSFSRNRGGRLDWFNADAYGETVAQQLAALQDGQLSPVFRTEAGWHVIRRVASREFDMTEENRRNQARQLIGQRKAEEEFERFLRQLRADAYVETRLGG